jgi:outer membrane protein OmpA-like peptidoglycan-associated protein
MTARSATASAEEARLLAMRGREAEREDRERLRAQARLDQARQEAAKAATAKEEALKQAHRTAQENEGLRTRLMAELSGILQTRATAQGLIVSMSGVLFKTGQSTLLPEAREKLAKVAGVLATRQGIRIKAEGFTDSTGTPGLNDRLSRERAEAARDFLVSQGVPADAVTFEGFGQAHPVADNATQAGRQENRRVELVVSGEGLEEQPAPEPGQH